MYRIEFNRMETRIMDGALCMARFDTSSEAIDWFGQHIADEEQRIEDALAELNQEQAEVAEMREALREALR